MNRFLLCLAACLSPCACVTDATRLGPGNERMNEDPADSGSETSPDAGDAGLGDAAAPPDAGGDAGACRSISIAEAFRVPSPYDPSGDVVVGGAEVLDLCPEQIPELTVMGGIPCELHHTATGCGVVSVRRLGGHVDCHYSEAQGALLSVSYVSDVVERLGECSAATWFSGQPLAACPDLEIVTACSIDAGAGDAGASDAGALGDSGASGDAG